MNILNINSLIPKIKLPYVKLPNISVGTEPFFTDTDGVRVSPQQFINMYNELCNQYDELCDAYDELQEQYEQLSDAYDELAEQCQ